MYPCVPKARIVRLSGRVDGEERRAVEGAQERGRCDVAEARGISACQPLELAVGLEERLAAVTYDVSRVGPRRVRRDGLGVISLAGAAVQAVARRRGE